MWCFITICKLFIITGWQLVLSINSFSGLLYSYKWKFCMNLSLFFKWTNMKLILFFLLISRSILLIWWNINSHIRFCLIKLFFKVWFIRECIFIVWQSILYLWKLWFVVCALLIILLIRKNIYWRSKVIIKQILVFNRFKLRFTLYQWRTLNLHIL